MECCNRQDLVSLWSNPSREYRGMIRPPAAQAPTWFDTRVFYVRVTSFAVDESTPDHLTLSYFPLGLDTVVRPNGGGRTSSNQFCVSTQLRRDRTDRRSEETTYVGTDGVKISGTVLLEVCDGDELLLSGLLELQSDEDGGSEKKRGRRWSIRCESHMTPPPPRGGGGGGMSKSGRRYVENRLSTVEVYVAGSFCGSPLVLTDTLHLSPPKKNHNKKAVTTLDPIPEHETEERKNHIFRVPGDAMQGESYPFTTHSYGRKQSMYHQLPDAAYHMRAEDLDNGELSWFNAGVRVGVGISLGLCVGVGLGVGLLVGSYQTTARNLKRRFF